MENQRNDLNPNIEGKKEETLNNTSQNFFLPSEVKKGYVLSIRARIDTLLIERGVKWADVYNELGWSKSFASIVRNGKLIPPNWQRVALAKQLGVDTGVIWDMPEVQSADNLQGNSAEVIK
jgi:hypothetical protein